VGFLDEGLSGEEFNEPKGLSEFLDVFLHRGNDVAGEIVVESVKFLSQFNRLLEELLVDQFFELVEVVFEEGTIVRGSKRGLFIGVVLVSKEDTVVAVTDEA